MEETIAQLVRLSSLERGYWAERVLSELGYAVRLSRAHGNRHDALLRAEIASLAALTEERGALTRELAEAAEKRLAPLGQEAKQYRLLCAAHAHIDMNWMWRYDETVSVTLDTFRTMLDLMAEYPDFRFSQSQASVYRIVEEHDPELLEEIRRRVKEGRWEVTASTWVECDKNMPSGESLARHLLYTRALMARLFGLEPEAVRIDFEPDTFGHSRHLPEVLRAGGVRYYYHCRGLEKHSLYRWRAPSGAELVAYCDPFWYNDEITPAMAAPVPEFCARHGMDTMMRVYGVGDHGGGPTRRDIERILDMDSWPVFPRVRFGTFAEYFALVEKASAALPVLDRELNYVFTGCYTTQTRIKAGERAAEARLVEAEAFGSLATTVGSRGYRPRTMARAWERVLFSQFHDILTGSGTVDTREFALGEFQKVLAAATTEETLALRALSSRVDTAGCLEVVPRRPSADGARADGESTSEGAGVGWGIEGLGLGAVERGRGRVRLFHVFNSCPRRRKGVAELTVWDWDGDPGRIVVRDAEGTVLPCQLVPADAVSIFQAGQYWNHRYLRLLVLIEVPAMGYATCVVSERAPAEIPIRYAPGPRVEEPPAFVLESELLRAEFDPCSVALVSLIDKTSGREMVDGTRQGGVFRLVEEDDAAGMTAWVVGRWMSARSLHERVRVAAHGVVRGDVRESLAYEIEMGQSKLRATVSLDRGSATLRWSVRCDWLEAGRKGRPIPQLNFYLPLAEEHASYRCDVPFGTIDRPAASRDVPATSWAAAIEPAAPRRAVMLVSSQTHGFRCHDDSLALTLVRSSYDPDPYPELGLHRFDFAVAVADGSSNAGLVAAASECIRPFSVLSAVPHPGALPPRASLLELEGEGVALSAVKLAEEGKGRLVVRLYETEGREARATLRFASPVSGAWLGDAMERRRSGGTAPAVKGNVVTVTVAAHGVETVIVAFDERARS